MWYGINWGGGLVLKGQYPGPIHVEGFRQLLTVCLPGWRAHSWILLAFPPFSQHVMCIVEIHRRAVRYKSIQLQDMTHNKTTKTHNKAGNVTKNLLNENVDSEI